MSLRSLNFKNLFENNNVADSSEIWSDCIVQKIAAFFLWEFEMLQAAIWDVFFEERTDSNIWCVVFFFTRVIITESDIKDK